jgi:hypothetical protein
MATKKRTTRAKGPARKAANRKAAGTRTPRTQRGKLTALLKKFEEQLTNQDLRISVAEYIRLLQMKRELEGEKPRDVKVTWVETDASEK